MLSRRQPDRAGGACRSGSPGGGRSRWWPSGRYRNPTLEVIERAYIMWVLQAEGGNKTRAAEVLGIDPSTLYRKLSRYEEQVEGEGVRRLLPRGAGRAGRVRRFRQPLSLQFVYDDNSVIVENTGSTNSPTGARS